MYGPRTSIKTFVSITVRSLLRPLTIEWTIACTVAVLCPSRYRVSCFICHGPLENEPYTTPMYAQLWFYDPREAITACLAANSGIDEYLLNEIIHDLQDYNPWVGIYQTAREQLRAVQHRLTPFNFRVTPQLRLIMERGADSRRQNLPTCDEIAAILPPLGEEYGRCTFRDLHLTLRNPANQYALQRVDPSHPAYVPLAYPLLFSRGDSGWCWRCRLRSRPADQPLPTNADTAAETASLHHPTAIQAHDDGLTDDPNGMDDHEAERSGRLTLRAWHAYHLHVREDTFNTLLRAGRLFQQFVVDAAAATEQKQLQWYIFNQDHIRADLYSGLQDALEDDDADLSGRRVILPSSYTRGDRFMKSCYNSAMAVALWLGKPTFFYYVHCQPQLERDYG